MNDQNFITRKMDHIRVALKDESEAKSRSDLEAVTLIHDSLPDLNFDEVNLSTEFQGRLLSTPFFIAGMTAGHHDAGVINTALAQATHQRGWILGLGSQRREIASTFQDLAALELKSRYPKLELLSNLGIAQCIELSKTRSWNKLAELVERTGASAIAIHLNPLQETVQTEGTPQFKGALQALENLKSQIKLPFILKETGSGMSLSFLRRIAFLEPLAVDVSGLGGTHWGRVEGLRAGPSSLAANLGECFKNWGIGTVASVRNARSVFTDPKKTEVWASGGIRNGLDAAKCLALGATRVGFAKPALQAALQGPEAVLDFMQKREMELRVALFCTNSKSLRELDRTKVESRENHHG